jgi:hypothetical protein
MRPARLFLAFWASCCLAACAKPHGEIAPSPIDPAIYADLSCRQLGQMHAKALRDLLLSEVVQDGYYAADRTRTFTDAHLLALRVCSPFLLFALIVNIALARSRGSLPRCRSISSRRPP